MYGLVDEYYGWEKATKTPAGPHRNQFIWLIRFPCKLKNDNMDVVKSKGVSQKKDRDMFDFSRCLPAVINVQL